MSRYTPGRYSTGYMFDRPSRTLVEEEPGLFLESSALRTIVDDIPNRRRDSPDRLLGRSSILSEKTNTTRSWDDPVGRYDNRSLREDILRDIHGKYGDSEYSTSSLPPLIGRKAASGRDSYSYLEKSTSPLARVRASDSSLPLRSSGSTSPLVGSSGRSSPSSSTGRMSPLASTGRSSPSVSAGTRSPIMSEDGKSYLTGLGSYSPVTSYLSSETTPTASSVPLPPYLAENKLRTPFTPLSSTLKSDVSEEGYFTGRSDPDTSFTKSRYGTSDDLQEDIDIKPGMSYADVKDPYNRYGEGSHSIYSRPGPPPPSYDKYEEQSFPSTPASESSFATGTPKAYPMPDLSGNLSSPRTSDTGFNDAASDSSSERRYVVVNKDEPTGRGISYKYSDDVDRYGNDRDRNDQGEEVFRYNIKIDPGSEGDQYGRQARSPDYSFTTGHGPDRIRIDIKHGDTPTERSHRRSRLRDLIGDFDFDIDEDWQSHASHIRDQFFGRKSGSLFDRDDDWDSFFGDRFSRRVLDSRDARDRVYGQESPRPREFRRSGSRESKEEKSTPRKGFTKKSVVKENEVEEIVGEDGKRRVIRKTKTEEEVEDDGMPALDTKEDTKESITPTPRDAGDGSDNVFNKMDLHFGSIGRYDDAVDCEEKNREGQPQERDAFYFRDFDDLLDRLNDMRTRHPEEFNRRMRREGYEPKNEDDKKEKSTDCDSA